ncbi:hypothetical protein DFJ63DRAFT_335153 [Scheffersomyces coipomensis]|uniref:uncharacterized protein n=1 Tax=Scheffersomyces coipomensis TaxID=1788519 RepID=UPI00315DB7D1
MTEELVNHDLDEVVTEAFIRNISMVNFDPLPDKLNGISNLVLLVDTTLNDDFDNIMIPDIPTIGQILYHNDNEIMNYEDSSQFFFDNAHKFKNPLQPLTITLQFKLGIHDDGSSMIDLLSKANYIKRMGYFNFKLYIFQIVTGQEPENFKIPPLELFEDLNCIEFKFDTSQIFVIEPRSSTV